MSKPKPEDKPQEESEKLSCPNPGCNNSEAELYEGVPAENGPKDFVCKKCGLRFRVAHEPLGELRKSPSQPWLERVLELRREGRLSKVEGSGEVVDLGPPPTVKT